MTHDEFISKESNRQRYWARSTVGWGWFSKAQFNDAHKALAELEHSGKVSGIITQNVDMLHQAAGSSTVIDLHGVNSRVICMQCGELSSRHKLQAQLAAINASWLSQQQEVLQLQTDDRAGNAAVTTSSTRVRADGDVELASRTDSFKVCACERCGGVLKPDVVFFGDSVPRPRVDECFSMVTDADALLVVGSSLMSDDHVTAATAVRFMLCATITTAAVKAGKSVAVLNQGYTRAEKANLPILKIDAGCSQTLRAVADSLAMQ
eukprot:10210-Heterococcus_DN1.PRE.1